MSKRLLLISNSTCYGEGYLDHCEGEMRDFLGGEERVVFLPYALADWDAYADAARGRLERMGHACESLHEAPEPRRAVEEARAFFVGGGNTFRLLRLLYDLELVEPLRRRVAQGAPYMGSSAGSNVACLSIATTNDMPIVYPPSFDALALVPFNLNPHYLDPDPGSRHMGESREQRIREFHEESEVPVVGLREGGILRVEDGEMTVRGRAGARVFRRGEEPVEAPPGTRLDGLLVS